MRNDIHTPSQIIPEDYQYVAVWTMNIQGIGQAEFILRERAIIKAHMARTGGEYAVVNTTGSCQVCGNVQAIYLSLHYHAKSNTYVRVGFDCEAKLGMSSESHNLFRRNVQNAREAQAGKRKAIAILGDAGLSAAWDIFTEAYPKHEEGCQGFDATPHCTLCDGVCQNSRHTGTDCVCNLNARCKAFDQYEERIIREIVKKLVTYGNISEKQVQFISSLLHRIEQRPIIEAQRQAEKDAAGPVPVGRVTMRGVVVGTKEVEQQVFGYSRYNRGGGYETVTKLIIKLENGSKVYGSRFNNVTKGDSVFFTASVEASKDDPKFGFYKRPVTAKTEEEIAAEKQAKKDAKQLAKLMATVAWG